MSQAGLKLAIVAEDDLELLIPWLYTKMLGSQSCATIPGLCSARNQTQDFVHIRKVIYQLELQPQPPNFVFLDRFSLWPTGQKPTLQTRLDWNSEICLSLQNTA